MVDWYVWIHSLEYNLHSFIEALMEGSKVARYAAVASRFLKALAIVGILVDVGTFIYAVRETNVVHCSFSLALQAITDSEERDNLREAIKELYVTRIITKVYAMMMDTIKTYVSCQLLE